MVFCDSDSGTKKVRFVCKGRFELQDGLDLNYRTFNPFIIVIEFKQNDMKGE